MTLSRKPSPLQRWVLEQGGDAPVYGPNLRASCRRMEAAGWLRTLSAPFLADEQARVLAEQCAKAIRVLPRVPPIQADEADDRPVELDGRWHLALRGDYVIRLDGTTCLQLWNAAGQVTRLEGDPLQVATWLQACHDAGIAVRVQINESATPEEGTRNVTAPADQTDTWYRQLDAALQAEGITGLNEEIRQAVTTPAGAGAPAAGFARQSGGLPAHGGRL
ncbi:Uncharacterised protein [Klebsiella pneumoniae]|nr:Uncharacterised protein [Klebsiella pneumoniae]